MLREEERGKESEGGKKEQSMQGRWKGRQKGKVGEGPYVP